MIKELLRPIGFEVYPRSTVEMDGTTYFLMKGVGESANR